MATYRTGQKEKLCEYLSLNSEKALTFDDICRALLDENKGKSTLYRHLSDLTAKGKVRRLFDSDGGRFVYQYICGDECATHLHLKCRECGRMMHLDAEVTRLIEGQIMRNARFAIDDESILFGRCERCASRAWLLGVKRAGGGKTV